MPKAILNFQQQTYSNKVLLIVADGESVRYLIPEDPSIRLVEIEDGYTIGAKRNFGCSQAFGEYIAHWDDDDFSAPTRIDDQLSRLTETGKKVAGYSSMYFTDGSQWWTFKRKDPFAIGSSLFYQRRWALENPFAHKQVGEDEDFVKHAKHHKALVSAPAGLMMVASIHPANTAHRSLQPPNWQKTDCPDGVINPCEELYEVLELR